MEMNSNLLTRRSSTQSDSGRWLGCGGTATKSHTTLTKEKHPCPRWDSNPQSQHSRGCRHRLNSFIHQNHILPPEQFGFCKLHSTLSQPARIINFITHGFNLRKYTGLVLLDIEKACDTLWLNVLLFKLISLHLSDYLLFFLKSYSEGCTFTVHLNGSTFTPKPTSSSLPQGTVLLTTSFSRYLSNVSHPPHSHLALYADNKSRVS
jgi:hypothetical protein